MKKTILLIILSIPLIGCYNAPDMIKPASWVFKMTPEDSPPIYKIAWRDGCESGMSSMTNTAYKTFYSFKQNPNLRSNPDYYKTWKDTYTFCRHYVYGILKQSGQRYRRPNDRSAFLESFMGAEGILSAGPFNILGDGQSLSPFTGLTDIQGIGGIGADRELGEGTRYIGGDSR